MARSSSTGLPFLVRRSDTGKFSYHRDVPAHVAAVVTGEVSLPWRWTIEPSFRDTKDIGFGMGLSRLRISRPDRRD